MIQNLSGGPNTYRHGLNCFTFLCKVFVHDQFSVPQIVEDGAKIRRVPVNQVGSRLVLQRHTMSEDVLTETSQERSWKSLIMYAQELHLETKRMLMFYVIQVH